MTHDATKIIVKWEFPKEIILLWACVPIVFGVHLLGVEVNVRLLSVVAFTLSLVVVLSTYKLIVTPMTTEIDVQRHLIVKRYRSLPFTGARSTQYPLNRCIEVRSFLTANRNSKNIVALIGSGGEQISVAEFEPGYSANGFFSVPKMTESGKAAALREEIALKTGVSDHGFSGYRWRLSKGV